MVFAQKPKYRRHIAIKHCSKDWFVCNNGNCLFIAKNQNRFVRHQSKVHLGSTKSFKCEKCSKEFRIFKLYLTHDCDVVDGSEGCTFSSKIRHKCKKCLRNFYSHTNFLQHSCISSSKNNYLKPHLYTRCAVRKIHNQGQDCSFCFDRYENADSLLRHIQIRHPQQFSKRFFCDICLLFFHHKSNVLLHRVRKHKKFPFHCTFCNEGLLSLRKLNTHVAKMHDCEMTGNVDIFIEWMTINEESVCRGGCTVTRIMQCFCRAHCERWWW